jgi:hypothetical protein
MMMEDGDGAKAVRLGMEEKRWPGAATASIAIYSVSVA